jgi:hypothetical protein
MRQQTTMTGADIRKQWEATMSEATFQAQIILFAHSHGWMVAHFRPSLSRSGKWHTAVQADGAGFVDLVCVHPSRGTVFAEIKSQKGRTSPGQDRWIETLRAAGQDVRIWRPSDWPEIERVLGG